MLAKRIIPCLDVAGGRVVKGTSFLQLRDSGDPVELAHLYYQEGADEVVMLDITATAEERHTVTDIVENISENVFVPLAVGGGIRSIDDVRRMLLSGADKVCINTAALLNPPLVSKSADKFGSQSIVVAIDAKRIGRTKQAQWEVYICAGQRATGTEATAWAKMAVELGAGEILVTSIDADGHRTGYDIELTRAVSENVTVPVIASGGAGSMDDLRRALVLGKADAVLAASIFHYGICSILQAKQYLATKGVAVRI